MASAGNIRGKLRIRANVMPEPGKWLLTVGAIGPQYFFETPCQHPKVLLPLQ